MGREFFGLQAIFLLTFFPSWNNIFFKMKIWKKNFSKYSRPRNDRSKASKEIFSLSGPVKIIVKQLLSMEQRATPRLFNSITAAGIILKSPAAGSLWRAEFLGKFEPCQYNLGRAGISLMLSSCSPRMSPVDYRRNPPCGPGVSLTRASR